MTTHADPMPATLDAYDAWMALRAELRALDVAAHPDIVDTYGRVWVWRDRELYSHDDTLCVPRHMVMTFGLPRKGLADDNPNYARLCATCRHESAPAV